MKIGGWRTRSMFDRYNIVDQADITDAMHKIESEQQLKVEQERAVESRYSTATVGPKDTSSPSAAVN